MQMTSRFTAAVHILTCIDYFGKDRRVTSDFLADSTGLNAVIIRNILSQLRENGIVTTRQGSGGANLAKPLDQITLYDIYKAVDCINEEGLFHFHENPNAKCPVGRNIHKGMENYLCDVQTALEEKLKSIMLSEVVEKTESLI